MSVISRQSVIENVQKGTWKVWFGSKSNANPVTSPPTLPTKALVFHGISSSGEAEEYTIDVDGGVGSSKVGLPPGSSAADVIAEFVDKWAGEEDYVYAVTATGTVSIAAEAPTTLITGQDNGADGEQKPIPFLSRKLVRVAIAGILLFGAWYITKKRGNVGAGGALAVGGALLLVTTLIPAFSTTPAANKTLGTACTSTSECDGTSVFCVANLDDPTKGTCRNVGPESTPCVEDGVVCKAHIGDVVTNNNGTCFSNACGRSVDISYTVVVGGSYMRHHKVRVMWPNGINVVNGLCVSTLEQSNKLDFGILGNHELVYRGLMAPYASWAPVVVTNLVGNIRFTNNNRTMEVNFGDDVWSVIQPTGGISNGASLLVRPVELGGLMAPPPGKKWSDVCQRYVYDWATATLMSNKKGVSEHEGCKSLNPALVSIGCLAVFEFMGFIMADGSTGDMLWRKLNGRDHGHPFDPKAMAPFINPVRIGTGVCADASTAMCYYNFATDPVTLSMLRACGKNGCGWNIPSGSIDGVARFYARPSDCHTPHCPVPVQKT